MPGLVDVAQLCLNIGAACQSSKADAEDALASYEALNAEIDATEQRTTSAGMTKAGDGAVDTKKLGAALQALTRRS